MSNKHKKSLDLKGIILNHNLLRNMFFVGLFIGLPAEANPTKLDASNTLSRSKIDANKSTTSAHYQIAVNGFVQNRQVNTHELRGIVTDDATGEPLVGVTVKIKGKNDGVITDIDGKYYIPEVLSSHEIVISYIGFEPKTLLVGNNAVINVKLNASDKQLGEVVVVGAGTQRKVSVTGAISSIKGTDLKAPTSSLTNNLAGKLAGVISMTSSGEPGSVAEFYIRGISTFGGRTAPLILLDDVEISTGDLNRIPPETIKTFTILKDASATAIYGARGANGVMLITTKTGEKNTKAQINVTMEASVLHPVHRVEFVDGPTYMKMYNEAQVTRNPGITPRYSEETIQNTLSGINPYVYPNVNWYKTVFKESCMNQRGNINVSGGGSRVAYYMSIQVNHNTGLFNTRKDYVFNNNYNDWEYIFQNNITYDLTETTKIGVKMNTQIGNSKGPNSSASSLLWDTWTVDPVTFPVMYPREENDKHIRFGNEIRTDVRLFNNPYANMLSNFQESNYSTINTSMNLDQKLDFITEGLFLTALVNWKSYSSSYYVRSITPYYYRVTSDSYNPGDNTFKTEIVGSPGTDFISQSGIAKTSDNTFYFDSRLNYVRRFGNHNLGGMLMYMMREFRDDVLPHRNQGISGRFTYDYDNKYLAEFNFGYNGTERIAKGDRFEFFPAMSLGWVISSEKFWRPLSKTINFLKLRGSYGLVGSDETGESAGAAHFLYINEVMLGQSANYVTGPYWGSTSSIDRKGPGFGRYAVYNAHWERAKELDLGFDMNLLNVVDITFDYFHNQRDRILMRRGSFPTMLGYWGAVPFSNVGKVDSKGFELSAVWNTKLNKDLHLEMRGNLTYNQNKYVYIDDPDYPYVWQTWTGKPLSQTTGYIAEGLFNSDEEILLHADQTGLGSTPKIGDIKYRDINGDGKITSEDQVMISKYGNVPRLQYGLGLSVDWKNFDLGVFFNGSSKVTKCIQGMAPFHGNESGNRTVMQWVADNYWSEANPNPNATYPRLGLTDADDANNTPNSTFWMRDFSFLRWKSLEIGYTFKFCRVYFSGDNLAVWSPFKYWDPEIWWNTYPLQRTFNIGLQVKL